MQRTDFGDCKIICAMVLPSFCESEAGGTVIGTIFASGKRC